jgi:nanoRNase/pAp phosphatase (c-di-AMP/oligoRNAs hydrolase)
MTVLTGRRQELDLIVTHERADFDAIASLVAAALLFPEARPVLPRQLNRNVPLSPQPCR